MINCRVNKGEVNASIQGNVITLGAEVCVLIRSLYNSIREYDKKSAEKFREIITDEVNGDVIFNGKKFDREQFQSFESKHDDDGDDEAEEADDDGDADDEKNEMIETLGKLKELAEALKQLKDMVEDED